MFNNKSSAITIDSRNLKKPAVKATGQTNQACKSGKDGAIMARKLSRSKRKALGIRIKPKEGMWIAYQLKLKGITGTGLAQKLGIRQASVSLILTGRRKSERVETALYRTLGYASFEAMIAAARGKGAV
jgi:hypothetical protein